MTRRGRRSLQPRRKRASQPTIRSVLAQASWLTRSWRLPLDTRTDVRLLCEQMFGKLLILLCLAVLVLGYAAHGSSGAAPKHTYVVRAGDTLWSIAAKSYAGDPREGVWEIQQQNHLASATISPGQKLLLP